MEVDLPNCKTGKHITLGEVKKQLDSLRRCQSLEEVQKLHEAGDHEKVVELLLSAEQKNKGIPVALPERPAQLLLLQDSLLKLDDYKRGLLWGEVSLHEGLRHHGGATSSAMQDDWAAMIVQLLEGLNTILIKDITVINDLPSKHLVRLTTNLIQVIQINMASISFTTTMPINTLLPWILLLRLIHHETVKSEETAKSSEDLMEESSEECDLPPYVLFLNIVHEYLGRRSWCVNCEGELLLAAVDLLMDELGKLAGDDASTLRSSLETTLEQCFYCLYGHPNKRTKAKHLQDHAAKQVELTWERAYRLFEYFKPKTSPEFDSYKTSTVSNELENLLRRISSLVPDDCNPANSVDNLTAYIDGLTDQPPTVPKDDEDEITTPVVKELYYLLADYYFKNKEQTKAIKFYQLDLCVNPCRMDSWAGMALARASRLQQRLNSHELKPEWPVLKHAGPILRCFKQALELDESNSKLWIEYGALAYELHSFASRQLKLHSVFPVSDDVQESAVTYKVAMLETAEHCYRMASECDGDDSGEEWLHHYMLGKIAEKLGAPPAVSLEHYKQAAEHLHEDHAKYPKRITYSHHVFASPYLAIESLEVYYRMHICVAKYLMQHDEDVPYALFETYLTQAAEGPFANCREKDKRDTKSTSRLDIFDELSLGLAPASPLWPTPTGVAPPSGRITPRIKSKVLMQGDHSYSKRKMSSEGSSQESADAPSAHPLNLPPPILSPMRAPSLGDFSISTMTPPKLSKSLPSLSEMASPSSLINVLDLTIPTPEDISVARPASPVATQLSVKNVFDDIIGGMIGKHVLSDGVVASSEATDPPTDKPTEAPVGASLGLMSTPQEQQGTSPESLDRSLPSLHLRNDPSETTYDDGSIVESAPSVVSQKGGDNADVPPLSPHTATAIRADDKVEPMDVNEDLASLTTSGGITSSDVASAKDDLVPMDVKSEDKKESITLEGRDKNKPDTAVSFCDSTPTKMESLESRDKPAIVSFSDSTPTKLECDEKRPNDEPPMDVTKSEDDKRKRSDEEGSGESDRAVTDQMDEHSRCVRLMDMCIEAMALCLNRFPQHYKSLYRLAYIYFHSPDHKNMEWSRNLLLGTAQWTHLDYMPCPGLLQDRKQTNFFQGLWRMPIAEIDRSGSFAAHLTRSLFLLFDVLRRSHDSHMLFHIHTLLSRAPDPLKKYIRDTDRLQLSQLAYRHCIKDVRMRIKRHLADGCDYTTEACQTILLDVHLTRQYAMKNQMNVNAFNALLLMIYKGCRKDQLEPEPSILDQALRYCHQLASSKPPTTPTGELSRSLSSTHSVIASSLLSPSLVPTLATEGAAGSQRNKDIEQERNVPMTQSTPGWHVQQFKPSQPVSALMAYRPPLRGTAPTSWPLSPTSPCSPRFTPSFSPRPRGRPRLYHYPVQARGGVSPLYSSTPGIGARIQLGGPARRGRRAGPGRGPGRPCRGASRLGSGRLMGMRGRGVGRLGRGRSGVGMPVRTTGAPSERSLHGIVCQAFKDPAKSNTAIVQEILQKVCAERAADAVAPTGGLHVRRSVAPTGGLRLNPSVAPTGELHMRPSMAPTGGQHAHPTVAPTGGLHARPSVAQCASPSEEDEDSVILIESSNDEDDLSLSPGVSHDQVIRETVVEIQREDVTFGGNIQLGQVTSGVNRQVASGVNRQVTSEVNRQVTSGVNRQVTSEVNRQVTSGVNRQVTSGVNRQLGQVTSGFNRQVTSEVNRQVTSGINRQVGHVTAGTTRQMTTDVRTESTGKPKGGSLSLQEKIQILARQAAMKVISDTDRIPPVAPPSSSTSGVVTQRKVKTTALRKPSSFSMDSLLGSGDCSASHVRPPVNVRMSAVHRGGNVGASVARPGSNVGASVARPGSNVGVSVARPGSNVGASVARPGSNVGASVARPGDNVGAPVARPGSNVGASVARPGDNVGAPVARPGGDARTSALHPGVTQPHVAIQRLPQQILQMRRGDNVYHLVAPSGVRGQPEDVITVMQNDSDSEDESMDFL